MLVKPAEKRQNAQVITVFGKGKPGPTGSGQKDENCKMPGGK